MKVELNQKIAEHFLRLENLAKEAEMDEEQSYSSRSTAMTALSNMIKELTKSQQEIVNMERLMKVEKLMIETINKHLTDEQKEEFLNTLENVLEPIE